MDTINNAFKLISVWMLSILFVFLGFVILTFIIVNLSGFVYITILQMMVIPYLIIGVIIATITTYYYGKEIGIKFNLNPE